LPFYGWIWAAFHDLHANAMSAVAPTNDPVLARVRELAEPVCASHAIDLVDVAWTTEGGARTLRVMIERVPRDGSRPDPHGTTGWGVSLEDCADVSRALSAVLDEGETVPGRYNLEVSSPGVERPLFSAADYRRFVGFVAKAKLLRAHIDGQRVLRGVIESVDGELGEERVTVRVDGKAIQVSAAQIASAHLVYELPGSPKSKSPPKSKSSPESKGVPKSKSSPESKGAPKSKSSPESKGAAKKSAAKISGGVKSPPAKKSARGAT
jgi:ribosome maturation factor RimP